MKKLRSDTFTIFIMIFVSLYGSIGAMQENRDTLPMYQYAPQVILGGHEGRVSGLAVSSNGRFIASSAHAKLRIWLNDNLVTNAQPYRTYSHIAADGAIIFSADSRYIIVASHKVTLASPRVQPTIKIVEIETGRLVRELEGQASPIVSLALAPDGIMLVSGGKDGSMYIWNIQDGRLLDRSIQSSSSWTSSMALAVNTITRIKTVILGLTNGSIEVFSLDYETSNFIISKIIPPPSDETTFPEVSSLTFSHDSGKIIAGYANGSIKMFDIKTGRCLMLIENNQGTHHHNISGHTRSVTALAVLNENILASASQDATIKLWDITTGALLQTMKGHTAWITSMVVDSTSGALITASNDKTVRVWRQ